MATKLPGVLSFQRGIILSDGVMRNLLKAASDGGFVVGKEVRVIRHGIRGVLPEKKKDSVSNIQRTESAKTAPSACGLCVEFSMRFVPFEGLMTGCSDKDYRKKVEAFIARFTSGDASEELKEVCRRYARNILNGRWLWRNRILGGVTVTATPHGAEPLVMRDGIMSGFSDYKREELELAEHILVGLLGREVTINVKGEIDFGFTGEVEVFPSQNMVTKKPDGFARSLYKVDMISRNDLRRVLDSARNDGEDAGEFIADMIDMGIAAIRDQKLGNALRTIDTWYAKDAAPIPVEPNGASLEFNEIMRSKNVSGQSLLKKIDEIMPGAPGHLNEEAAYLIALLIRGGVFSEGA
jgi:CRISPR-associated protein Csy3